MTDETSPFWTDRGSFAARRSGAGSVSMPQSLGQPFPSLHCNPYHPQQRPTLQDLASRIYDRPIRPRLRVVRSTDATPQRRGAADK